MDSITFCLSCQCGLDNLIKLDFIAWPAFQMGPFGRCIPFLVQDNNSISKALYCHQYHGLLANNQETAAYVYVDPYALFLKIYVHY
jgi:hypothetical protein